MVADGAHNVSRVWPQTVPDCSQKWVNKPQQTRRSPANRSAAKSVTEITVAAVAASIASRRGLDLEAHLQKSEGPWAWDLCWRRSMFLFKLFEQPSAEIALASCVVLGFTVSSYINRNHAHDRYQSLFFLIAGGTVASAAFATEASKQLVLLVYVPWAACLAMTASSTAHMLWRQLLQPGPSQVIQADGKYIAPRHPPQRLPDEVADSWQRKGRLCSSRQVDIVSRRRSETTDGTTDERANCDNILPAAHVACGTSSDYLALEARGKVSRYRLLICILLLIISANIFGSGK